MRKLSKWILLIWVVSIPFLYGQQLLIPMDLSQTDHLKAYGVAYHALQRGQDVEWLLNYRGGSFLVGDDPTTLRDCVLSGVVGEEITGSDVVSIYDEIERNNMEIVLLEKAPTRVLPRVRATCS